MKKVFSLLIPLLILGIATSCSSKYAREVKQIERQVKKSTTVEELENLAQEFDDLVGGLIASGNIESTTDKEKEANQNLIATYDSIYPIIWNKELTAKLESLEFPSGINSFQEALNFHQLLVELPESIGQEGMSELSNVIVQGLLNLGEATSKQELIDTVNKGRLKEFERRMLNLAREFKSQVPIEITSIYTSRPNSVGGVDAHIRFANKSKDKTFKYVFFEVVPYNAVGDVVCDDFDRTTRRLTDTGPYSPGQNSGSGYWSALWYDYSIKRMELKQVEIIFTDGTEQLYSGDWLKFLIEKDHK